ncbi:MAG TPA: extracellular solute-binding protein, partial [Myxococcota bacterium]|nr:extracellular solute-binding protein [Myxococcota bacterium]
VSNWVDHTTAINAYMKEFPAVRVSYVRAPTTDDLYAKATAGAIAGTPIDAFWLHDAFVSELVGKGTVRPLDEYVKRDKDAVEDIYPIALKYHTRNGKLYGVPQNLTVFVMYYDRDRFAEVGVPPPKAGWTLSEWQDAMTRIARSGPDRLLNLPTERRGYYLFLKAHGGSWTDEAGKRSRLGDAETIAGVQYLKDLFDRLNLAVRPLPGEGDLPNFQRRQSAMHVGLTSAIWALRKENVPFTWDLAEPPKGPKGQSTTQAATGWVLGEGGKNLDAAWHFVRWVTGEGPQRQLMQENALMSSRRKVVEDPKANQTPPENFKAMSAAHGMADYHANPTVVITNGEKAKAFSDALTAALSDIFANKASVKDALTAADQTVKQQNVFE